MSQDSQAMPLASCFINHMCYPPSAIWRISGCFYPQSQDKNCQKSWELGEVRGNE